MEGTILEYIAFGDESITRSKVKQISADFGFHAQLSKLEGIYDAQADFRGEWLSLEQQRMVSILRTLCRKILTG